MAYELINSDCLEYLKNVEDAKFDLVITSPPYNIGKSYEQRVSLETYLGMQKEIIRELVRVCRSSICWQVGNYVEKGEVFPLDIHFYPIFKELGLKLRNRIIWHFNHGLHCTKRLSGRYETILWFSKDDYIFNLDDIRVPSKYPGKKHFKGEKRGQLSGNPKGKNPSDLWEIVESEWDKEIWEIPNVKSNHVEKTSHPCQFPVELVERCVLALTNEDGWVLDPFGGVGSTAIAALKHNRQVVSIELKEEYHKIAQNRIKQLEGGHLKTRPLGKPIFVEKI